MLVVRAAGKRGLATWALEGVGRPSLGAGVFIAPSASVVGDVKIGDGSNIWYNCVLRGDVNQISVGERTNIQDGTVIHVAKNNAQGYTANNPPAGPQYPYTLQGYGNMSGTKVMDNVTGTLAVGLAHLSTIDRSAIINWGITIEAYYLK